MPKYFFQGSYSVEGIRGLQKDGGSKRRAAAQQAAQSVGGKLDDFYFALGTDDVVGIIDLPDNASAAAVSLVINAAGAFKFKTTVLLTPEEMDQATKKSVTYTPPGR
ncbi:MAG: GYD domain-containing protein [Bacillati bacterium ANGP1]|uniref:GYD domain-containing protein n=1 Tax=Candidatus Segetimicrobium genomatis TaxID=2569760 RepID=A0A537L5F1_9BACT|nr:MAG: GYD domain-containing protein [Terrabacteria group bacterium ANGP1]